MTRKKIYLLFVLLILLSCSHQKNTNKIKYVFYLHGRIVELQGVNAVSEKYGKYEYDLIIESLKEENVLILSEIRHRDTEIMPYAKKIVNQIDSLIKKSVSAENITIIGASKGAIIAMQVSTLMKNKKVNYVFLAGYNKSIDNKYDFNLYGNILGFYEKSDKIAGNSYQSLINQSNGVNDFKEIELNTNLGHGIVFKPLIEWIKPTREWINKKR